MGNFWNPQLKFLKTELHYNSVKIEQNAYFDWYLKVSKHYQKPKFASLQNKILRITEAGTVLQHQWWAPSQSRRWRGWSTTGRAALLAFCSCVCISSFTITGAPCSSSLGWKLRPLRVARSASRLSTQRTCERENEPEGHTGASVCQRILSHYSLLQDFEYNSEAPHKLGSLGRSSAHRSLS